MPQIRRLAKRGLNRMDNMGYCVKCRDKREMKDAQEVTMPGKGGSTRHAMKGSCSSCGTGMYKILPKA